MQKKGWIQGRDDPRASGFQVKPEWVATAADYPIVKAPIPTSKEPPPMEEVPAKRVWPKRMRTEYFRDYMREYRKKKPAQEE
jgi:hypothetical protein